MAAAAVSTATVAPHFGASQDGINEPEMSYGQISFVTLQAVFQTVVICLIGYWAARSGYLTRSVQKNISTLNVMVFTPCLIFSKMASSLSLSALIDISVIPVIFVVSTSVSYMCGRTISRQFGLPKTEENFVIAMAVFGNSNSVPVSLTVSLCYNMPLLRWPDIPGDTADSAASRALLYLLIFQQLGQMLRWSWGYNTLLAKPGPSGDPEGSVDLSSASIDTSANTRDNHRHSDDDTSEESLLRTVVREVRAFMNPPLWAMLSAIIVASIPPLKNELYGKQGGFINLTVGGAIKQVGNTAIPLILVVLGANLAPPAEDDQHMLPPKSPRYRKILIASMLSRMVLPVLIMLPIIAVVVKFFAISILDDPVFLVSCFILTVSPPAIQLSQICQLNQVFELEMAGVLFWGYAILSLPSSVLITVAALEVLRWAGLAE